jgi:hypothetical protein
VAGKVALAGFVACPVDSRKGHVPKESRAQAPPQRTDTLGAYILAERRDDRTKGIWLRDREGGGLEVGADELERRSKGGDGRPGKDTGSERNEERRGEERRENDVEKVVISNHVCSR